MGQDKEDLIHLLNFVKRYYAKPGNEDFTAGLQAMVIDGDMDFKTDISEIRKALEMRGDISIDYGFVKDKVVYNQLRVDNLRMENALLNLTLTAKERFTSFCINAFFQVENLINYYYNTIFNNVIADILSEIETETANDGYKDKKTGAWKSTAFKRNGWETRVGDIAIEKKLNAFCNKNFPYDPHAGIIDFTSKDLGALRKIRNNSFHRGGAQEPVETNNSSYKTENEYRAVLSRLVDMIRSLLKNNS